MKKNSLAALKVFWKKHVQIPDSRRFPTRQKGIPKTALPIITLKNAGNMSIIDKKDCPFLTVLFDMSYCISRIILRPFHSNIIGIQPHQKTKRRKEIGKNLLQPDTCKSQEHIYDSNNLDLCICLPKSDCRFDPGTVYFLFFSCLSKPGRCDQPVSACGWQVPLF